MKRKTLTVVIVVGTCVVGALIWAFSPRPLAVDAAQASTGPFETAVQEDGRTRVLKRHAVAAPISGRLRRIELREGDMVTAGQVVATIEPLAVSLLDERSFREQQSRVAALEASLQRSQTRVGAAQVMVEQAENERQRTQQLAQQGFVSRAKLDGDALALEAARREHEAAIDSQRVAQFELAQAQVALQASGAVPTGSGPPRSYGVRSPASGRILKVHQASEGQVAVGSPLLDLGDTSQLEVVVELLTSDAAAIAAGSPVRIERWGGAEPLTGRLQRIEPAAFTKVSALGVEEQRVNAWIELLPSNEPVAIPVGDGWRVVAHIVTRQEREVLRVPVSAVFPLAEAPQAKAGGERMGVFVVDGRRARQRTVLVGGRNAQWAWILSGLSSSDRVIVYPPAAVQDGTRIDATLRY